MSAPVSRTPDEKSARFSKEAGIFPPIGFLFGLGIYKYGRRPLSEDSDEKSARFSREVGIFPPLGFSLWLEIQKYVVTSFKKAQRFVYIRFLRFVFLYRSGRKVKGAMKLRLCFVVAV